MNYSIKEINEYIEYWTNNEESEQRDTVLSYWIGQAKKFIKYSRKVNGELIANTAEDTKQAIKIVANFFNVPMKKKGESRYSQMQRLTSQNF